MKLSLSHWVSKQREGFSKRTNYMLSIPSWVAKALREYGDFTRLTDETFNKLKDDLRKYKVPDPEVSIVIPAYNEEKNILKTLATFASMESCYRAELIVVDNNSSDRTREFLELLEVNFFSEPRQGISFARQSGLEKARGKYLLNADADSLYPPGWIDAYVEALKNPQVTCVYGTYSFIPSKNSSRFFLSLYEIASRWLFRIRRRKMDFFNVLGFNFAFRREDGLKVGGFNIRRQRWSDGWMAMSLAQIGRIEHIRDNNARVWTSDRRLVMDGGLPKAVVKRFSKVISRYLLPLNPKEQLKAYRN